MNTHYSCAVIGHSPMRFAWGFDEEDYKCQRMKKTLLHLIEFMRQKKVTRFYVACDCGVGLYASEIISRIQKKDDELCLFCVIPHEEQSTKWAPYLRDRYFEMLEKSTACILLHTRKTPGCQLEAYRRIIDCSDIVLAVYDPKSFRDDDVDRAMRYAARLSRPIVLIHPDTFDIVIRGIDE